MSKVNLSAIVSSQLPEFIRDDYPTFIAFVEAYYEYLDSILLDINTTSNIDTTLDSFIQYFKDEIAVNFPQLNIDERFLYPKLKELYTSKGTEASYQLLFRLLYNKEVEIFYPSTQMLRVSDGKWNQDTSIFAKIDIGSPDIIVGQYCTVTTSNKTIKLFIDRYQATSEVDVYEFFITGGWIGTFYPYDILKFNNIFFATIQPTPVTVTISQPGKNFRVGQIYQIIGSGYGSAVKIKTVDANGGVTSVQMVDFGIGYTSNFSLSLLATTYNTVNQDFFTKVGTSVGINDSLSNLNDSGVINRFDYAFTGTEVWVDPSYAGVVITSFSDISGSSVIDQSEYAILNLTLGAATKYPGYYKNNDGFLSDTMYIQDSKYYQQFSYVIKIDELFESYKSVVKNLLHPAGTELFGEYNVENSINVGITANTSDASGKNLLTELSYTLVTEDGLMSLNYE